MENNFQNIDFSQKQLDLTQNVSVYITKVYNWMAIALLITGVVAYFTSQSETLVQAIFGNKILFFGLIIGELALVGYISARINKISSYRATLLFLAYTVLNGLTMAVIFLAYTSSSISTTFIITAGTFGTMSLYGYYTKSDLTKIGNLAFMALIGVIIASWCRRAASIPPLTPVHDITVAPGANPPSNISSQPSILRPLSLITLPTSDMK